MKHHMRASHGKTPPHKDNYFAFWNLMHNVNLRHRFSSTLTSAFHSQNIFSLLLHSPQNNLSCLDPCFNVVPISYEEFHPSNLICAPTPLFLLQLVHNLYI